MLCNYLQQGSTPELDSGFQLLEYVLREKNYDSLEGIQLLPSENGTWIKFSRHSEEVYICTPEERAALLGLEHKILNTNLSKPIIDTLKDVAEKGMTVMF